MSKNDKTKLNRHLPHRYPCSNPMFKSPCYPGKLLKSFCFCKTSIWTSQAFSASTGISELLEPEKNSQALRFGLVELLGPIFSKVALNSLNVQGGRHSRTLDRVLGLGFYGFNLEVNIPMDIRVDPLKGWEVPITHPCFWLIYMYLPEWLIFFLGSR